MNQALFFEEFGILVDAPNGVQKLRELILQLVVRGKLVEQDPSDGSASVLLEKIEGEKRRLVVGNNGQDTKVLATISDKIFDIPSSWLWTKLGNLGITQTGTTPSKNKPEFFGNYIPFVKPADMGELGVKYDNEMLSELGLNSGRLIPKNSVLMVCIGGSIGKTSLVDRNVSCNQQINAISPFSSVDSKFINYILKSKYFQDQIIERVSFGTIPIINKSKWEQIPVPLPPLDEQKRIVDKVDELMALCDKLEIYRQKKQELQRELNNAALDRMLSVGNQEEFVQYWQRICENFELIYDNPENVEKLKQTILQLAVQGKLVTQDANDEPAGVLLESVRVKKERLVKEGLIKKSNASPEINKSKTPYKIPYNWKWVQLIELCDIGTGSTPLKTQSKYYQNGTIPWITSSATSLEFVENAETYITQQAVEECRLRLYPPGTLIVALYGQGKTRGQVAEIQIQAAINQACAALVFIDSLELLKGYVKLVLRKQYNELRSLAAGGAQPNLNIAKIKNTLIPLPPLKEQNRIVKKVDALMNLCNQLEEKIRDSQKNAETLMDAFLIEAVREFK